MANRTMQAKALKLQRQLRKMPRRMPDEVEGIFEDWKGNTIPKRLQGEAVSVPRQPNRELMQGYQHRAKSLSMDNVKARFKGVTPARCQVIEKVKTMMAEDNIVREGHSFTILDNRVHRARVFYDASKTFWVLVYENFRECIVRRSTTYMDKVRLIDDFKSKSRRLVWVETKSLPNHSEGGS